MRLRLSLRVAIGVLAAASVALAWLWYTHIQPVHKRIEARNLHESRGAGYSDTWYEEIPNTGTGRPHTAVNSPTLVESALQRVFRVPDSPMVLHVSFREYNRDVTDDDLSYVRYFPEIEYLQVTRWVVAPNATPSMPFRCEGKSPLVTDASAEVFARFPHLRVLILNGCGITDEGCSVLARNKSIELLGLDDTKVSDEGLMLLANCPSIKHINVRRTGVTRKGINAFERVRPEVKVTD